MFRGRIPSVTSCFAFNFLFLPLIKGLSHAPFLLLLGILGKLIFVSN